MIEHSEEEDDLFDETEAEIVEAPTFDEKLDTIIELLKKNEREHEEIKERLTKIENNQHMLQVAYRQHGKQLGELVARMDRVNGSFGGG